MVFFNSSNNPPSIESHPTTPHERYEPEIRAAKGSQRIKTLDANFRVYPEKTLEPEGPIFHSEPQEDRGDVLREDGFLGTSYGHTECLMELRLHDLAMVKTVAADLGVSGKWFPKKRFMATFTPHVGKAITERAYMYLNGRNPNHHKTNGKNVLRDRYLEFCVIFSSISASANTLREKITENSERVSKRGRVGEGRPSGMVYLPTEGEDRQVLRYLCFDNRATSNEERKDPKIAQSLATMKYLQADGLFEKYEPAKPYDIMKSKTLFRGFFEAQPIFEAKEPVKLPRYKIARHGGVCEKTAMNDLKKHMEVDVKPNPLILKQLNWEDIDNMPTVAEAEMLEKQGLLPGGVHIRDAFGENGKAYPYGKEGALAAKASGTNHIYMASYPMNTYDGRKSKYNPFREVIEISAVEETIIDAAVAPEVNGCAFISRGNVRCDHNAVGSGNPFCRVHANRYGKVVKQKHANNDVIDDGDIEYTLGVEAAVELLGRRREKKYFLKQIEQTELLDSKEFAPVLDSMRLRQIPGLEEGVE